MPFNKSGSELVLDLLNDANQTNFSFEEITFEDPLALDQDPSLRNTILQVTALPKHGFTGNVSVKYNRVDIANLTTLSPAVIQIPVGGNIEDVLFELNSLYYLELVSDIDINSAADLTGISTVPSVVTLDTLNSSYAYRGSLDVTISHLYDPHLLDGTITSIGLDSRTSTQLVSNTQVGYIDKINGYFYVYGTNASNSTTSFRFNLSTNVFSGLSGHSTPSGMVSAKSIACAEGNHGYYYHMNALWRLRPDINLGWQSLGTPSKVSALLTSNDQIHCTTLVGLGSKLYLIAGADSGVANTTRTSNIVSMMSFDIATSTWTGMAAITGTVDAINRYNAYFPPAVCSDDYRYIYVLGGRAFLSETSSITSLNRLYRYDTQTNTWSRLANAPTVMLDASVKHLDGYLYTFGGTLANGSTYISSIYRYNIATNSWDTLGTSLQRKQSVVDIYDNKIFLYGGRTSGDTKPTDMWSIS